MGAPKERIYPEAGELLIATVTRIDDYGVYVTLDEYNGMEGLIHISEISSTWVRNIRDHVKEGQKLVLKVLRVNPSKGEVDLSLRRVTTKEKTEKMMEWKKLKKAESIIRGVSVKFGWDDEAVSKTLATLYEKYENPYDAFEESLEEGEEVFFKLGFSEEVSKALVEAARSKIRLEKAKKRAKVELVSYAADGIERIKTALKSAKKIKKKGSQLRIYTLGAPRYAIEVTAKTPEDAENILNMAVKEVLATISSLGGKGRAIP